MRQTKYQSEKLSIQVTYQASNRKTKVLKR